MMTSANCQSTTGLGSAVVPMVLARYALASAWAGTTSRSMPPTAHTGVVETPKALCIPAKVTHDRTPSRAPTAYGDHRPILNGFMACLLGRNAPYNKSMSHECSTC
jgi:hypothetical protein